MKTKREKHKLFSRVMGNGDRTIETHEKEGRPYIKLLEYFSKEELEELINTGEIKKLKIFSELSAEYMELISTINITDLKSILTNSGSKIDKEKHLKDALFKVEIGMEKAFVLALFKEAIDELEDKQIKQENIRDNLNIIIRKKKLGLFAHENHKKITLSFIKAYLTDSELQLLAKHYKTSKS